MSWLDELKTGDTVLIQRGRQGSMAAATVERATKTQIVVGGEKYRRSDGWRIGYRDPWGTPPKLREDCPENRNLEARQTAAREYATKCRWLSDALIRAANRTPDVSALPMIDALTAHFRTAS